MAKKKRTSSGDQKPKGIRITNRKARHEYFIVEKVEAGIELRGTEVKSIRAGQAKIDEAHVRIRDGEAYLVGMNIAVWPHAKGELQHEPTRDRRLLLHGRQIDAIAQHVTQGGRTAVPLTLYFKRGWAKIEIGLAEGKRQHDKRQDLKARQHQRDIQRELRRRR